MNAKDLKGYALLLTFVAVLLAGWTQDVAGARNLVHFFVWVILLPLGVIGLFSDDLAKSIAKDPPKAGVLAQTSRLLNWSCLLLLIWWGSLATGIAFGVFMLGGAVARNKAAELRKAAA